MSTFQLFEKHIKNHLHFYRQEMLESSPRYQISGSQMFITLTKVLKSGFFIAQNLSLETMKLNLIKHLAGKINGWQGFKARFGKIVPLH